RADVERARRRRRDRGRGVRGIWRRSARARLPRHGDGESVEDRLPLRGGDRLHALGPRLLRRDWLAPHHRDGTLAGRRLRAWLGLVAACAIACGGARAPDELRLALNWFP